MNRSKRILDWEEGEVYFFPSRNQIGQVIASKDGRRKNLLVAKNIENVISIPLIHLDSSFLEGELVTMMVDDKPLKHRPEGSKPNATIRAAKQNSEAKDD